MENFRRKAKRLLRKYGYVASVKSALSRVRGATSLLRPVTYSLHKNEDLNPFFIVGPGRCGTTLLRSILQASPEVHIPPENWKLGHTIALFQKYRWILSWEELVHLVVGMHEHQGERWFSEPPTDLVNDLVATSEENQTLSEILDQLYRFHGDQQSVAFNQWGDKTPMNVRFMHSILDVFPEAKFIYMSRDVVDVVHSWIQTGYYDEVEDPALRWKRAAKNAEEFSSQYPDRLIRIRYEHLVRDPTQSVKHICNFVGVSFDPSMLERRSEGKVASEIDKHDHYAAVNDPISDKNIGKGHENMPEKIKKKIRTIVRDK